MISPCTSYTWPFWNCLCFHHQTRLLHDFKLPQFCKWDLCSSVALIGSYWLPRSVFFFGSSGYRDIRGPSEIVFIIMLVSDVGRRASWQNGMYINRPILQTVDSVCCNILLVNPTLSQMFRAGVGNLQHTCQAWHMERFSMARWVNWNTVIMIS